ncbi:hypothetical protein D3C86_2143410 [compost metagenome]
MILAVFRNDGQRQSGFNRCKRTVSLLSVQVLIEQISLLIKKLTEMQIQDGIHSVFPQNRL